jgi:hypothetical protein
MWELLLLLLLLTRRTNDSDDDSPEALNVHSSKVQDD